jgi:hypothetical protein
VSTPLDDWDPEERVALAGMDGQLAALRERHRGDPSLDLLRAARADALPPDLQTMVGEHLRESHWSRTLLAGADPGEALDGVDRTQATLAPDAEARLLARIVREAARAATPARSWWSRPAWLGVSLGAAALTAWVLVRGPGSTPVTPPPESIVAIVQPPAPAPFQLSFEKPEVRLSMAALTWRGSSRGGNPLLAALKPAFNAYRTDDYVAADREFATLAARYPDTVEVRFYQGVTRLLLNDAPGAIVAFAAAESTVDPTFAADVRWYRAVAEHRAGHAADARVRLDALCRAGREDARRACAALTQVDTAQSSQP